MVKLVLLVKLEAKPGKEVEVEKFLKGGLSLVQQEPGTEVAWSMPCRIRERTRECSLID